MPHLAAGARRGSGSGSGSVAGTARTDASRPGRASEPGGTSHGERRIVRARAEVATGSRAEQQRTEISTVSLRRRSKCGAASHYSNEVLARREPVRMAEDLKHRINHSPFPFPRTHAVIGVSICIDSTRLTLLTVPERESLQQKCEHGSAAGAERASSAAFCGRGPRVSPIASRSRARHFPTRRRTRNDGRGPPPRSCPP
jgi:hypothetical protein